MPIRVTTLAQHRVQLIIRNEEAVLWTLTDKCYRHKRTHERGDVAEGGLPLSGEEEEDYSGEDQLGSIGEASPTSEGGYVPTSLNSVANSAQPGNLATGGMTHAPAFNPLHTLSMPMTMSTPTGAMM